MELFLEGMFFGWVSLFITLAVTDMYRSNRRWRKGMMDYEASVNAKHMETK